jgi:hypothetical protein
MFRSSTIVRELALNLAKVIFMFKNSVELHPYLLCGCVAACYGMACVLQVQHATHIEFLNINITLFRFSASSLTMVEDRNL